MLTTISSSRGVAEAARAALARAAEAGVVKRAQKGSGHWWVWRYDGVTTALAVELYDGKKGLKLCTNFPEKLQAILAGDYASLPPRAQAGGALWGRDGCITPLGTSETSVPSAASRALAHTDLSDDQAAAFGRIRHWALSSPRGTLSLGGYAGTGKSTLIGLLARELGGRLRIAFAAPTGKAATVLTRKLLAQGLDLDKRHSCGTVHRLFYVKVEDPVTGELLGFERRSGPPPCDLIVIDEASMVRDEMLRDLLEFGRPILAVGDHGQLPPVEGTCSLMQRPDLRLERIHRQAEGNPILQLADAVRRGADPFSTPSTDPRVRIIDGMSGVDEAREVLREALPEATSPRDVSLLCHTNRTRAWLNSAVREGLGFDGPLAVGETLVCLRNAYFKGALIANGVRGELMALGDVRDDGLLEATIRHADEGWLVQGRLVPEQLGAERTLTRTEAQPGMLYDFGYALTVHKAQGSQVRRAVVVVERSAHSDSVTVAKWLYTAVTRATDEVWLMRGGRG